MYYERRLHTQSYKKAILTFPGGLWNEEPATSEMADVAARVYSSMVTNDDRETNPFSDFPHEKVSLKIM